MKGLTLEQVVIQFVDGLPEEYIPRIAASLQKESEFEAARVLHRLQSSIPQIDVQNKMRSFVEDWAKLIDAPSPAGMSILITSVAAALTHQREKQSIELIWTGPKSRYINVRRTDQALIDLINSAKKRITIVSFAVYKAKNILSALEKAANRGVEVQIIVESPDAAEGKITYDAISALGSGLKSVSKIFIWPLAKRESLNGKFGSLHAKVAVGDVERLYITSANLTDYAMELNLEMGLLVAGGDLPKRVQNHFDELIQQGILSECNFRDIN
jgi:phosphatidylserine/phosphatidylglycerophosphate/cardiolipin synthase-like enzyme